MFVVRHRNMCQGDKVTQQRPCGDVEELQAEQSDRITLVHCVTVCTVCTTVSTTTVYWYFSSFKGATSQTDFSNPCEVYLIPAC